MIGPGSDNYCKISRHIHNNKMILKIIISRNIHNYILILISWADSKQVQNHPLLDDVEFVCFSKLKLKRNKQIKILDYAFRNFSGLNPWVARSNSMLESSFLGVNNCLGLYFNSHDNLFNGVSRTTFLPSCNLVNGCLIKKFRPSPAGPTKRLLYEQAFCRSLVSTS